MSRRHEYACALATLYNRQFPSKHSKARQQRATAKRNRRKS